MNVASLVTALLPAFLLASAGTPQAHPASYAAPNTSPQANQQNFNNLVNSNQHLNQHVPSSPLQGGMRVVTFNINAFRDFYTKQSTLQAILNDIKSMNADVYLLQEIDMNSPDKAKFESSLKSLGYTHQHTASASGATLGNMIASKHPLFGRGKLDLGANRIMVDAQLSLNNNEKMTLFCAHWDNKDALVREKQADITVDVIKKRGGDGMGKFVLGADFNATWPGKSIQTLAKSGLMTNSFDALHWQSPNVTAMPGRAVDFLWAGNDSASQVAGAYVYYTLSSDHLPLIMDLNVTPSTSSQASKQRIPLKGGASSSAISSLIGLVFATVFTLVILY